MAEENVEIPKDGSKKPENVEIPKKWEEKPNNGTNIEGEVMNKKERKAKHKALKPISKKHPEFELAYDMMLGIRTVVGRIEATQLDLEDSFSLQNKKE